MAAICQSADMFLGSKNLVLTYLYNFGSSNAYPFPKSSNKNISNKVTKLIKISKIQDACLNLTGRPFFHFQFSNISHKTIKKKFQKNFQKKVKKIVHGF